MGRRRTQRRQAGQTAIATPRRRNAVLAGSLGVVAGAAAALWWLWPAAGPRDGSPAWSPDGSRLAFYSERDDNADIYVMDANGGNVRRLTTDASDEGYPSWSPDGARLAFMFWRSGRTELYVMNADGREHRKLVTMERGDAIDPRWSPDGSRIAFVHMPGGMNGEERAICLVNADGTGVKKISR